MPRGKAGQKTAEAAASGLARLVPTQQRSRERFEKILNCAAELMAEKGSEAFRMSDVVERSGVPFGSLYQYFPDKTAIIGTLAERYNAIGRDCVRRDLAAVRNIGICIRPCAALPTATIRCSSTCRSCATSGKRRRPTALAKTRRGGRRLSRRAARRRAAAYRTRRAQTALASFSQLIMTLIAATVRHAITQDAKEAGRILTLFKRMLPKNLAALEM